MIETLQSRSHHNVMKWEGRWICSSVDPIQEAQKWALRQREKINGLKQVIVLGVGCGYHLAALQRAYPEVRILAIDSNKEFIDFAIRENSLDLSDAQFICVSNPQAVIDNPKVRRVVKGSYSVLVFAGATAANPEFYRQAEEFLLARTATGFRFLVSQRPELKELFAADPIASSDRNLISIRSLDNALPSLDCVEVLMFKTLRELVS